VVVVTVVAVVVAIVVVVVTTAAEAAVSTIQHDLVYGKQQITEPNPVYDTEICI
jgi:hypothetical protein